MHSLARFEVVEKRPCSRFWNCWPIGRRNPITSPLRDLDDSDWQAWCGVRDDQQSYKLCQAELARLLKPFHTAIQPISMSMSAMLPHSANAVEGSINRHGAGHGNKLDRIQVAGVLHRRRARPHDHPGWWSAPSTRQRTAPVGRRLAGVRADRDVREADGRRIVKRKRHETHRRVSFGSSSWFVFSSVFQDHFKLACRPVRRPWGRPPLPVLETLEKTA
jgi:hypothetical protein